MSKKQAYTPPGWNFVNNFLLGTVWDVSGSKGDAYCVELTTRGFTCSCAGFVFYGKCKHTKQVADRFDE